MSERTNAPADPMALSPANCTRPAGWDPCSCCETGVCDCGFDKQCSCGPCYVGAEEPEAVMALAELMGPAFVAVAEDLLRGSQEEGEDG
jgi:hypothetical protein